MLFRKKSFKDNIKLSKFKRLESESAQEAIPGRLAISLVAPFVIVALFLWVFSKQAVVSPPPPPSGEAPTSIVSATADKPQSTSLPAGVVGTPTAGVGTPTAGVGTPTARVGTPTAVDAAMPVGKTPSPSADIAPPQEKITSNKPVAISKRQAVERPPKKMAHAKAAPRKEEPVPAKPVREIPPVKPVKIVDGRPRSPLEEKESKSKGTPSKAAPQMAKRLPPKMPKKEAKNSPVPQVAKVVVPPPAVTAPVLPPRPSDKTPAVTETPAATGTPAMTETPAPGTAPALPAPADKKNETIPEKKGGHSYGIQVGAFQIKEDAQKLAFRLKEQGYDAYIVVADLAGQGMWHRVRIGHYPDRAAAQKEGEKISNAERLSFFITSD